MIHRKALTSSCLSEASYDDVTKKLTLMFARNDSVITLYNVPKRIWEKLRDAESPGNVYNYDIRGVTWEEDSE